MAPLADSTTDIFTRSYAITVERTRKMTYPAAVVLLVAVATALVTLVVATAAAAAVQSLLQ